MLSVVNRPVRHIPARTSLGERLGDVASNGLLASHREHAGGGSLPKHEHGAAYLCIVLAGGYAQTAEREIECTRGSLISHPAGHVHSNLFGTQPTRCVNLYFDRAWLDDPALCALLGDYGRVQLDARDGSLARLEREVATPDAGSALGVASAMLDIASRAVRKGVDRAPSWLAQVRDSIMGDPAQPPSLAALAAEVGIHPAHLCRSFREATGETVGAFSRRARLEIAFKLLAAPQSLAGIAAATGFCDQAHFARCFRRQYGLSPGAARAQIAS